MMRLVALSGIRLLFYMEASSLEYARNSFNTLQAVSFWVPDIRSVGVVVLEGKERGYSHLPAWRRAQKARHAVISVARLPVAVHSVHLETKT